MAATTMRPKRAPVTRGKRRWSDAETASPAAPFEEICARYYKPIYSFVYRMVGNPEDAGDVTQDAFLSAYRAFDRLDEGANVNAWLYRIATNKAIDALRQRGRIQRRTVALLDEPGVSTRPTPEDVAVRNEVAAKVERVLAQMTPRYREALLLKEYLGCSVAEIARLTGRSEPAIKSVLFRSREQFRSISMLERALSDESRR